MARQCMRRILVVVGSLAGVVSTSGCSIPVDRAAHKLFLERLGHTSITVFPAFVRRGRTNSYDATAAAQIAAFFTDHKLADAVVPNDEVLITGPWHHSQPTIFAESVASFKAYLESNPVNTDYALLPEYFMGRTKAGGIHCYLLDSANHLVFYVFLNSHWDVFAENDPRTERDCTRVVIEVFRRELAPEQTNK